MLTQYGTIESAVEVTRLGAIDYVTKPFRIEELRSRLERAARAVELQQENRLLREQLQNRPKKRCKKWVKYWKHGTNRVAGEQELAGLIESGAADFVERKTNAFAEARGLIQQCLRQASKESESGEEAFGDVPWHELNNPLTGILENAELLLAEIRKTKDGKIPGGGEQRLATIATLAVRLRETVRRLSEEWETRKHSMP